MRAKLETTLGWLEKAGAVIAIVVPATRGLVSLFESNNNE